MSRPMSPLRSLDDLLAEQPPPALPPAGARERCLRSLRDTSTAVIALDDDPTGTQAVRDVPVVTVWGEGDLSGLLEDPVRLGFVLTNSRSLDEADAIEVNREIADRVLVLARERGTNVELVSRSDSTLRGHLPAEISTLAEVCGVHGVAPDVLLLCPAFPEAGRITIDGTHWVGVEGGYLPVGASEFSRDATFGYASSFLPAWVEERTRGRIRATAVRTVTLTDLRIGGAERVAEALDEVSSGTVVAADVAGDEDLVILALGIALVREGGRRILHRSGPSLLAPLVGQRRPEPLLAADLAGRMACRSVAGPVGGGITVVGSHTSVSTAQLEQLLEAHPVTHVELDVDAVLADTDAEVTRVARALASYRNDGDVVISTSRARREADSAAASLALSRRVSDALVQVVARTVAESQPSYVVAKGGITSSDVATRALGVRRATVIGQMIRGGLPVWQLPDDSRCPGLPYVIFPGNVGDRDTLATTVGTLRSAAAS